MATARDLMEVAGTRTPAVALVPESAPVCGVCAYHIPHAARPSGWCACEASAVRWQTVSPDRPVCDRFAVWPEGSAAPAYIAAMGF